MPTQWSISVKNGRSGGATTGFAVTYPGSDAPLVGASGFRYLVDKLSQQAKTEFHLIELQFGNVPQTGSILSSAQNANNIAPPPGSVISLLVGNSSGSALPVANLPSLLGNNVSTSA